ncbi:hypothetical protein K4L44_06725 [Halosquirtibacter laminarini]|uniref:Uncharacterized protein n=1 Tax=Halosquirtibacter laminarini TaxID=3374600 RepID=A0AC61NIH0_9BACT|nr:hypothetical protein K4L44_06725 [Prolixibacteraceae bacterium]
MKRIATTLGILFLSVFSVQSQNKSISDRYLEAGNLKKAIEGYKKDYNSKVSRFTKKQRAYKVARAYAFDGNQDSTFRYLYIACKRDSTVKVLRDPAFYYYWGSESWITFEDMIIENTQKKYGEYKSLKTSKDLWNIRATWELLDYQNRVLELKGLGSSSLSRFLGREKMLLEKDLAVFVTNYVEKNGWPKDSELGRNATLAAALIVYNSSAEKIREYLSVVKASCEANETLWGVYAYLYDKLARYEDRPQKYGTQMVQIDKSHKGLYRVESRANLDKLREEMGLQKIDNMLLYGDDFWGFF